MSALNFVGIRESARVNFAMTMTELTGLLVVIIVGVRYAFGVPLTDLGSNLAPTAGTNALLAGATVAFFAYIGFEDTANIAEEVRDPSRVLPRAILTAITVTCLVYVAVTLAALAVVRSDSLATSDAPLLLVLETAGLKLPAEAFAIIALIAICNTGLLNLIMVSRLMYGMAREGLLPAFLTYVHPARRTPSTAVAAGFLLAALLAASGGVQVLAQTTSLLLLCVFAVLHVGLVRIRLRDGDAPNGVFRTPLWTPIAGALICGGMTLQYPMGAYVRALIVTLVAAVLYFGVGRRALLAHNEAGKSLP
jgi:amino acid transporter